MKPYWLTLLRRRAVKHFEANSVRWTLVKRYDVLFVVTGSFRVTLFDQLGAQKYRGNVGTGGAIGFWRLRVSRVR